MAKKLFIPTGTKHGLTADALCAAVIEATGLAAGAIADVRVCEVISFIDMRTEEAAREVVEAAGKDSIKIGEKSIKVEPARERPAEAKGSKKPEAKEVVLRPGPRVVIQRPDTDARKRELEARERDLRSREATFNTRSTHLDAKEQWTVEAKRELEAREGRAAKRERDLDERERRFDARARRLAERERGPEFGKKASAVIAMNAAVALLAYPPDEMSGVEAIDERDLETLVGNGHRTAHTLGLILAFSSRAARLAIEDGEKPYEAFKQKNAFEEALKKAEEEDREEAAKAKAARNTSSAAPAKDEAETEEAAVETTPVESASVGAMVQ